MKKEPSQSIYDTRGSQQPGGAFDTPEYGQGEVDPYVLDFMRRQRRQTIVFYLVLGLAGLLLAGMIYFWFAQSRLPSPVRQSTNDNLAEISYPLRPGETPPLYQIDPLKQIIPQALPTNGPAEWSAEWIKTAVYHILQAEKAMSGDRLDTALEEYSAALKIYPTLKGVHKQMGLIYLQQKKYGAAANEFELVLKEEAPSFGVMNNVSIAYLGMGNLEKAERALLETVKMDPAYPLAYYNLAMLAQKNNDLPKTVDYLEQYTRLRSDDFSASENLAMILLQLQRWEKAAAVLAVLAHTQPQSSIIHFRLAQAYSHIKDRQDLALDTLQLAINLVDSRKALTWLSRSEFDLLRSNPRFKKMVEDLGVKGKG